MPKLNLNLASTTNTESSFNCAVTLQLFSLFFQFVPFRDFQAHGALAQDLLTKEVLAELPDQLLSFMTKHAIKPKPPQPLTVDSILPIMPQSTNQTVPFGTQQSAPYPVDPRTPPYPTNQSTPYSTNQRPPYPTNSLTDSAGIACQNKHCSLNLKWH